MFQIPVVDGDFVPKPPLQLLNDVNYLVSNDILSKDIVIGVNNNEGGYVLDIVTPSSPANNGSHAGERAGEKAGEKSGGEGDDDKSDDVFTAFAAFSAVDESMEKQLLRSEISYRYPEVSGDEGRLNALVDVLNFFYLRPLVNGKASVLAVADSFADAFFTTGAVEMSRLLAKAADHYPKLATGHRYLYLFDHFPAYRAGQPLQGMNHGEDLFYQFDASPLLPKEQFNDVDRQVEDTFIQMPIHLAKNGNAALSAIERQLPGGMWPEFSLGRRELPVPERPAK
ncbi:hypothetical protein ACOMHN_045949 [Nucella lapillus]